MGALGSGEEVVYMSARRLVSKTTVSYSMALSAGAVGLLEECFV